MCGIVGYVGPKQAYDYLIEGLFRLEYRGYDSAGVALQDNDQITVRKKTGRVGQLAELVKQQPVVGNVGIGHTRWATHGEPNDTNSHPHTGGNGEVVLVHNGVIENYATLRNQLTEMGYVFRSATDTEVAAHLIAHHLEDEIKLGADPTHADTCVKAVEAAIKKIKGTYGLAILFRDVPGLLIAARLGSPLVVGIGKDEHYLASDASPLVGHTDEVVYLNDHELAVITADQFQLRHQNGGSNAKNVKVLEQSAIDTDLGEFEHYMLKEIFEQPVAMENALRGRLDDDEATAVFGGLNMDAQTLRRIDRIVLTACGTSWHSGLVGEYLIEEFARIPVEVEYASELRYRNPPMGDRTMVFAITQSGETADTLAAMRECKRKGHPTLAICNVVGSTIAREADGGIYLHAGAGDRSRLDKSLHVPSHRPDAARPVHGPHAQSVVPGGQANHQSSAGDARQIARDAEMLRRRQGSGSQILHGRKLPLHGPVVQLPGRSRRSVEAQGNQLHPRGRLSRSRDETRPDRPH